MTDNESQVVAPYSVLARVYDRLMSHVNYLGWARFVISILTDHGLSSPTEKDSPLLLECACGTGTVAFKLAQDGFDIEAFDHSPEMIDIATAKLKNQPNRPRFIVGGFLDLDQTSKYDAALCLYDSINYLMTEEDVLNFLGRIKRSLKPDGLFLFDICTKYNSKLHFNGDFVEVVTDLTYRREMAYDKRLDIQENTFTITFNDRPDEEFVECHQQRIYTVRKIRSLIKKSGLRIVEETDDTERKRPHSQSLRVHFLCRN